MVPAYALTIHRSQSLSLDRVAVDFSSTSACQNAFPGAVYVALSRCKTLYGLWVRGLRHEMVVPPTKAQTLLAEISNIEKHYPSKVVRNKNISIDSAKILSRVNEDHSIRRATFPIRKRRQRISTTLTRSVFRDIQQNVLRWCAVVVV